MGKFCLTGGTKKGGRQTTIDLAQTIADTFALFCVRSKENPKAVATITMKKSTSCFSSSIGPCIVVLRRCRHYLKLSLSSYKCDAVSQLQLWFIVSFYFRSQVGWKAAGVARQNSEQRLFTQSNGAANHARDQWHQLVCALSPSDLFYRQKQKLFCACSVANYGFIDARVTMSRTKISTSVSTIARLRRSSMATLVSNFNSFGRLVLTADNEVKAFSGRKVR